MTSYFQPSKDIFKLVQIQQYWFNAVWMHRNSDLFRKLSKETEDQFLP